jgi:hypothetical protein
MSQTSLVKQISENVPSVPEFVPEFLRRATGLSMFGLLDYRGWPGRRLHSPRAERMKVKPPSPPSAQSVQTKKKPPVDLAISP